MPSRILLLAALLAAPFACFACQGTPDVNFVGDDASSSSDATLGADANGADGASSSDGAQLSDTGADAAQPPSDAGGNDVTVDDAGDAGMPTEASTDTSCLGANAPDATACCANGEACYGAACSHCDKCTTCASNTYCCVTVNNGGQVTKQTCKAKPVGDPQCQL